MNMMKKLVATVIDVATGEKKRAIPPGYELDHASRQIDCARWADEAIKREPKRARFAIVDPDVFT